MDFHRLAEFLEEAVKRGPVYEKALGMDVEPSTTTVKFTVCIMSADGEKVVKTGVKGRDVAWIIARELPDVVAVDDMRELFLEKSIVRVLRRVDKDIEVLQVNKLLEEEVKMEVIARALLGKNVRLSPEVTAEILAYLALHGVGWRIPLFRTDFTKIVVSRRKVDGAAGGMSQRRFSRNVSLKILQVSREIARRLEEAGIDYDLFYRKSAFGLQSATFYVYAPRERLYGIVRSVTGVDVKIRIERVSREFSGGASFRAKSSGNYLIVGVDPGIVTGVAILDLDGNLLYLGSHRELSRNDLIKIVTDYGKAVVVATDVRPAPDYVKKLCSMLKATLYEPPRTLTVAEKQEAVSKYIERYGISVKSSHERDALAAAIKAFNTYLSKFTQVEIAARNVKDGYVDVDKAKILVLQGKTVKEAVKQATKRDVEYEKADKGESEERVVAEELKHKIEKLVSKIAELQRMLSEAESRVRELESRLKEEREKREALEKKISEMASEAWREAYRERIIKSLAHQVEALNTEVAKLRAENELLKKRIMKLSRVIEGIAKGELAIASEFRVPGAKYLVVRSLNGVREAEKLIFKGTISWEKICYVWSKTRAVIIPLNEVVVTEAGDGVYIVDEKKVMEFIKRVSNECSVELDEDTLLNIVEEYRKRRAFA